MKPPVDPTTPGLPRQYPSLESLSNVPQAVKTSIRRAYQHIYDLRDELLQRTANGGSGGGGCGGCTIFKGVVATEGDLPTTGNETGDGWITEDTGHLWVWDGTTWVDAGSIMGPPGPAGPAGAPGAPGPPGAPGAGSPAYISSLFAGPDTTRTISGATHGYATAGLLVAVYDNASPRNAIEAGWTVDASTYDVVVTFAAPQANYYVVVNGATGPAGPPGSGGGGGGTVTSVALTMPGEFSVSGSPVTTSGTLAVSKATQSANTVFAGPATGSAAAPTFRAIVSADLPSVSSGALILLEQHTASSSASLDFTSCITSAYDEYLIEIVNLIPATTSTNLLLRCSTDGGATYDSAANYQTQMQYFYTGGTNVNPGSTVGVQLAGSGGANIVSNDAHYGVSGSWRLFSPLSTSLYKIVHGACFYFDTGVANIVNSAICAVYKVTTAVNAFRIVMSSGNIASGTVRVYGFAK